MFGGDWPVLEDAVMEGTETVTEAREMLVEPRFGGVADRFFDLFQTTANGGGALAVYLHGELVVDVWAGWAAKDKQWTHDTVALCFSTGKGVASTVIHRLADRGLVDYDQRVAAYWPEFAANGKGRITVRQLMSHRAGLHNARAYSKGPHGLLDTEGMATAMAAAEPDPRRFFGPGYHALTYGNLVAEVASRVTGQSFTDLLDQEIARPLGQRGFWFQMPEEDRVRVARVFPRIRTGLGWATTSRMLARIPKIAAIAEAGMADGFDELVRSPRAHDAVMPGWNGVFSAPALARMYAPLANGGVIDGQRFLKAETVEQLTEVQTWARDYVLGIRPNWRLGYHPAWLRVKEQARRSVGHYGYGGTGAFADPETGLSVAFVTNRLGNNLTTVSDLRLPRLGASALWVARQAA
jgi:CubicO group peptidase (beta-lactamase class C family)